MFSTLPFLKLQKKIEENMIELLLHERKKIIASLLNVELHIESNLHLFAQHI